MVKSITIALVYSLGICFVFSQNTFVPNDNFEQRLIDLGYDTAPLDNFVPTANIASVTMLSLTNLDIDDLTGIEDFIQLENLNIDLNNLTALNLSTNTNLEVLTAANNQIESVNLSGNPNLKSINLSNNRLTSVDFSNNPQLDTCNLNFNNISNLGITNNSGIANLSLIRNNLTSFTAPIASALEFLQLSENPLTNVDISNATLITSLEAIDTQLNTIDLSQNTFLSALLLSQNNFETIDISVNTLLFAFWIDDNPLTELDTSLNTALREIRFGNTQLLQIDLRLNTELERIDGRDNDLLCSIDIRNGNNTAIAAFFYTLGSSRLECVFVDNINYSEDNWTDVDPTVNFAIDETQCMAICCPPGFDFEFTEANISVSVEEVSITMNEDSENFLYSLDDNLNYQESPVFLNVPEGLHTIFVTDINGCVEKSIDILVPPDLRITIPPFFTPNNDGNHDFWKVKDPSNQIISIFIFNRYGKLLKELAPNSNGWDGIFNGSDLPVSDYWYKIQLENASPIVGHFTLKR